MKELPYWLKLLEYYQNTKNRTGLTLPFIIGSLSLSDELEQDDISSLLAKIRDNEHKKVIIKYCETIKDFIVSVSPNLLYGSQYNKKEFDNLIVIQSNGISGIDDFEDILTVFHLDYDKHIKAKKFSKEKENWCSFNSEEKKMITIALKN